MKHTTKTALITLIAAGAIGATTFSASAFGGHRGGMDRGGPGGAGGFMQMEFAAIDADGNGQITVEDLLANAKARFDTADANKDGQLDLDEMKAQARARMDERLKAAEEAGRTPRRMPDVATIEKRLGWKAEDMLERRDADKNGTLSFEEVSPDTAKLERLIDRHDTDDDNAISAAEFDQAQKDAYMRGNGHGGRDGRGGKDCDRGDRGHHEGRGGDRGGDHGWRMGGFDN